MTTTCTSLLVNKGNIHECTLQEVPRLQEQDLQDGEVLLDIDHFAFTANNITYATLGGRFGYWDFFPAEAPWGQVPVWGFADVSASRHPDIAVGTRVYGYLPMAGQLRVRPGNLTASSFTDTADHRSHLALAYNQYQFTATDPAYRPELEALQMLLRPLLLTSFLLDDFLQENGCFGAEQIILTSASSKTAYGTAFCLEQNDSVALIGLTSGGNTDFVAQLGCYQQAVAYEDVEQLDASIPTLYVDFSGNVALRNRIHEHFKDSLVYDCYAGSAQNHEHLSAAETPVHGPAPQPYFAPYQIKKRNADWGAAEVTRRFNAAQLAFIERVQNPAAPWLNVIEHAGLEQAKTLVEDLVSGRIDPKDGHAVVLD